MVALIAVGLLNATREPVKYRLAISLGPDQGFSYDTNSESEARLLQHFVKSYPLLLKERLYRKVKHISAELPAKEFLS